MNSTPIYYKLDAHREMEITLRMREYNGIDSDPGVIVREPTFSEAMTLAGKLQDKALLSLTTEPDLDYDAVNAELMHPGKPQ